MRVKFELTNIGGLQGAHEFGFQMGKVNVIEAPNAAGKSSLIKGLAAVLSAPFKNPIMTAEAERLGLTAESLINVYEDEAYVRLKAGDQVQEYHVTRGERIVKSPNGDERFLLGGILSREAKLSRKLLTGSGDFYWIVSNMSLAEDFEHAAEAVERKLSEISLKRKELEEKATSCEQLREEQSRLKGEKKRIENVYENLRQKLSSIPVEDPKLKELSREMDRLKNREKRIDRSINKPSEYLKEKKSRLEKLKRKLSGLETENRKLRKRIDDINWKLQSLSPDKIRELERTITVSRSEIDSLRRDRTRYEVKLNLFDSAFQAIGKGKERVTCPLCGRGEIPAQELKKDAEELRRKVQAINSEIAEAMRTFEKTTWKRDEMGMKRSELEEELDALTQELKGVEGRISSLKGDVDTQTQEVENGERKVKAQLEKLRSVRQDYLKKAKEKENYEEKKYGRRQKLTNQLEKCSRDLGDIERRIRDAEEKLRTISTEFVADFSVNPEVAKRIYQGFSEELESALSHLRKVADEERRGVAREFNTRVGELLKILGFGEFEDISLSEDDYKLQVYRRGGKYQRIPSLSISERSVIAAILQIAMKMTYLQKIPYFIIDAVSLDFDKSKVTTILNYLARLAEKENWLIILTKLKEKGPLTVHTYEANAPHPN